MKLAFHGAARGVTGSCYLVECAGTRILIDCGLFQGGRELEEENAEQFGFDPVEIGFVLLTHAHLDHCGRLPLLVKRGFRGEIVTTAASRELARLVLLDAAHLQEEEAVRRSRQAARRGAGPPAVPLYTTGNVLETLALCRRTARYGVALPLAAGVTVTFLNAGHILGSASVLLELDEGGGRRRLLFSGDLGNRGRPLLGDAPPPPQADTVVMETTYGDRLHKPIGPSVEELYTAVDETLKRGGNVIIPTFALERAQELLFFLRAGTESSRLPQTLPVFLDSPMAISATDIFAHYGDCLGPEARQLLRTGHDPFAMPGLRCTRTTEESMALNRVSGGAVIIAGSGMCAGGRVRHHLRHNLDRHASAIVFVGYAARGTPARRIIDGAPSVWLFGEEVAVRARIHTINGFSAHADQAELRRWHRATSAGWTFLVHGDAAVMRGFAALLENTEVQMPELHQTFDS